MLELRSGATDAVFAGRAMPSRGHLKRRLISPIDTGTYVTAYELIWALNGSYVFFTADAFRRSFTTFAIGNLLPSR